MALDLNLLQCFQVVADHESISAASQTLHLTQPAISLQIKKLEDQLGVQLFDRHNRGLTLTPVGSRLLVKVRSLMVQMEDLRQEVNPADGDRGTVRVGSYTTATSYLLPRAMADLHDAFPEIETVFHYEDTHDILSAIKTYRMDCAILSEVPAEIGLRLEPLFASELVLVTAQPRSKVPDTIRPSEISDHPFLSYPSRFEVCYQQVEKRLGTHLKKCPQPITSTNFETLKRILCEGVGLTFMPRYLVEGELSSGALRQIHLHRMRFPIQFSLVSKEVEQMAPVARNWHQFVLKWFT